MGGATVSARVVAVLLRKPGEAGDFAGADPPAHPEARRPFGVQVPLALCGMFAGDVLRREAWTPARRAGALAAIGAVLTVVGLLFVAYLLPALVCFFPACPVAAAVGKLAFCWLVLWLLARAKVFVKV